MVKFDVYISPIFSCLVTNKEVHIKIQYTQPRSIICHKQILSKHVRVMHLFRCLWFITAVFNIHIMATYINGKANNVADMLSGNQAAIFLKAHPHMLASPTSLSSVDAGLDFYRLFRKIYQHAWQYLQSPKTKPYLHGHTQLPHL